MDIIRLRHRTSSDDVKMDPSMKCSFGLKKQNFLLDFLFWWSMVGVRFGDLTIWRLNKAKEFLAFESTKCYFFHYELQVGVENDLVNQKYLFETQLN